MAALALSTLRALRARLTGRLVPLVYSTSTLAIAIAQLVAGVLVVKWIVPTDLGTWQSVRLLQVYSFLLLFGLNNGLSRELPYHLGRDDTRFSTALFGSTLFAAHVASAAIALLGVLATAIAWVRSPATGAALLTVTLLIPLTFYQNVLLVTYRSRDAFTRLTGIQFVEAALSVATVPLVYYYGYIGLLVRTLVISAVVVGLMARHCPMPLHSRYDRAAFRLLFRTGFPIFALDYLRSSSSTFDRVLALRFGGVAFVGYYALAGLVLQTLQTIPKSISQYVYPKMTFQLGRTGDARPLWGLGLRWFLLTSVLMAGGAIVGFVTLDTLVARFAPDYIPGLRAAKLVLVAGVFESAAVIANILWSMKAWWYMTVYQVISALTLVVGPLVAALVLGRTLDAIAIGVVAASAARCALALGFAHRITCRARPNVVVGAPAAQPVAQ